MRPLDRCFYFYYNNNYDNLKKKVKKHNTRQSFVRPSLMVENPFIKTGQKPSKGIGFYIEIGTFLFFYFLVVFYKNDRNAR